MGLTDREEPTSGSAPKKRVLCASSGEWEPGDHLCPYDLLLEEDGRIALYDYQAYPRFPNANLMANVLEQLAPENLQTEGPSLSSYMIRYKIPSGTGPTDPETLLKYLDEMEKLGLLESKSSTYRTNPKSVARKTKHYNITKKGLEFYRQLKGPLEIFRMQ